MKTTLWITGATFLTLAAPRALRAQEHAVRRADLPVAVRRTVDAETHGATIRGYTSETEDGIVAYEVEMTANGRGRDVLIGVDGTVLEVEEEVMLDSLPAAVRAGLKRAAGRGTMTKVESLTKHGKLVAYEAQVTTAGKHTEVQVGPDGKPLAHEE